MNGAQFALGTAQAHRSDDKARRILDLLMSFRNEVSDFKVKVKPFKNAGKVKWFHQLVTVNVNILTNLFDFNVF